MCVFVVVAVDIVGVDVVDEKVAVVLVVVVIVVVIIGANVTVTVAVIVVVVAVAVIVIVVIVEGSMVNVVVVVNVVVAGPQGVSSSEMDALRRSRPPHLRKRTHPRRSPTCTSASSPHTLRSWSSASLPLTRSRE